MGVAQTPCQQSSLYTLCALQVMELMCLTYLASSGWYRLDTPLCSSSSGPFIVFVEDAPIEEAPETYDALHTCSTGLDL